MMLGKLQRAHPTLRGHFAHAYLAGSNIFRAYLFRIYGSNPLAIFQTNIFELVAHYNVPRIEEYYCYCILQCYSKIVKKEPPYRAQNPQPHDALTLLFRYCNHNSWGYRKLSKIKIRIRKNKFRKYIQERKSHGQLILIMYRIEKLQ